MIPSYAKKTDEGLAAMDKGELIAAYKDLLAHHVNETTDLLRRLELADPPWTVTAFNENTLRGVVSNRDRFIRFFSTNFLASTHRWPRVGERVKVVFNDNGTLLSVHGDE
jgi:hypothetical protein